MEDDKEGHTQGAQPEMESGNGREQVGSAIASQVSFARLRGLSFLLREMRSQRRS